jgi:hypothetical protein
MARTKSTSTSTGLAERPPGTGSGQDPLADAGQQAGESIGQIAERATNLGYTRADTGREQVAHSLTTLASGIRRASSDIAGEQPALANVTETAAEQTDRIARYLQQTDAREIVHNVEDLARRQPLLFLGGAFVLGLAASRLLKAASGGSQGDGNGQRPAYRSGYGTGYSTSTGSDYRATGPGASSDLSGATSREGI